MNKYDYIFYKGVARLKAKIFLIKAKSKLRELFSPRKDYF